MLNSVLAFMEEPNSTDSLVIAATNHSEILDKALARRFDEVVDIILLTRRPDRRARWSSDASVHSNLGRVAGQPSSLSSKA